MSVTLISLLLAATNPSPESIGTGPVVEEKQICERQIETGSRLRGKRVCKTKQQWEADAAETRRSMRERLTAGLQTKN